MKVDDELQFLIKNLTGVDAQALAPGHDFPCEIICPMGNLNSIKELLIDKARDNAVLSGDAIFYVEDENQVMGIAAINLEALDAMREALKELYYASQNMYSGPR